MDQCECTDNRKCWRHRGDRMFSECDAAEAHAKVCRCVVKEEESEKCKSLAGEFLEAAEFCLETFSKYGTAYIQEMEKLKNAIAKAREAGL